MNKKIIVEEENTLYEYLRKKLNTLSKNNVKNILKKKMVLINNEIVTAYNYKLKVNDVIEIKNNVIETFSTSDIKIIYEDKDIIVVDKPCGMLTIATEKDKDSSKNLYSIISSYVKKKNANNKIFIVHRLDKDTSGVILFAKNIKTKEILQNNWNNIATRIYYAVVEGKAKKMETIKSYLKDNDNLLTNIAKDGKLAITHYKKLKENDNYSLLEIKIDTGRRNQIRVQLASIGYPIVGDSKYGNKNHPFKRMLLHAKSLDIVDNKTSKVKHFEADVPRLFFDLIKVGEDKKL